MENKSNDATPLRPEGDRILNAPLVEMDLNKFIEQLKSEVTWKDSDRNTITVFKSDKLRIVLIGLKPGAELKKHTAPGFISVQVIKGHIEFTADPDGVQQKADLQVGQMIALQPQIPHHVLALEETFFLLTLAVCK